MEIAMRKNSPCFSRPIRRQYSILLIHEMVVTSFDKSAVKNLVRTLLRSEGHYSSRISNLEYKLLIGRGLKLAF